MVALFYSLALHMRYTLGAWPMSIGGQVVSRPVVVATLAADHRVADGHRGSRFLAAVERLLQAPEKL